MVQCACLAKLMAGCALVALAAGVEAAELPPHPRLLLSRERIAELKERADRYDWARTEWTSLKKRADENLDRQVELPPRGGNWAHWYACPTHGCPLKTGKQLSKWEWEHNCPVGGESLKSDPSKASTDFDACVIGRLHGDWANTVRDLGLVYQVTADRRYAGKAREILLAYAECYPGYPLHNVHGEEKVGGGKMGAQSLDESVRLIPLCQGADMVWDTLSEADRKTITSNLFLPAVREVILPHHLGVHNIQCWKNSAVGLVGLLTGDQSLVDEAIHNPDRGYWTQVRKGVLPDGGWWEGAWGYHFYTLSALWPLMEAARNCGINLYGDEVKRMFDAPIKFAMPNLKLPAFNDSNEVNLAGQANTYELAYTRYKQPAYLSLLSGSDRRGSFALWLGTGDLPEAPPAKWQSINYPESGYAVLARGEGREATWLCLKYGPHGGGHGHPDKLGFVLCSGGNVVAVDPGTALYGLPIQAGWYKTTLAHNTLVVDQASQKQAEGKCIAFGSERGVDFAVAESGDIYDGVRHARTTALVDENLIVLVDHVLCERERVLDIAYHQRGEWENLSEGTPWKAPEKPGYSHLRDAAVRPGGNGVALSTRLAGGLITIALAAGEPTEVITATGPGSHAEDRVPVVVFRRKCSETAVIWAISLDGKTPRLDAIGVESTGKEGIKPAAVRVAGSSGRSWRLLSNPGKRQVSVPLTDGSLHSTSAAFAVIDDGN